MNDIKKMMIGILSAVTQFNIVSWLVTFDFYDKMINELSFFNFLPLLLGIMLGKVFLFSIHLNNWLLIGLILGGLPHIIKHIKIKHVALSHLVCFLIPFILTVTFNQQQIFHSFSGMLYSLNFFLPLMKLSVIEFSMLFWIEFVLCVLIFSRFIKKLLHQFHTYFFCAILGFVIANLMLLFIKSIQKVNILFLFIGIIISFILGGKTYD